MQIAQGHCNVAKTPVNELSENRLPGDPILQGCKDIKQRCCKAKQVCKDVNKLALSQTKLPNPKANLKKGIAGMQKVKAD